MEWMTQIPSQFSPLERIYSLLICGEEKGLRDAIKDQISWRSILHLAEKKVTSFVFGPERQTKFSFWLFVFSGRKTTFSYLGHFSHGFIDSILPPRGNLPQTSFFFIPRDPLMHFVSNRVSRRKSDCWSITNTSTLITSWDTSYLICILVKEKGGSLRNIDQETRVPRCHYHVKSTREWDRNSQQKVPLLGWSKQIIISKVSFYAIRPSMWNTAHRHDTHSDIIGPRLLAIKVGLCSVVV